MAALGCAACGGAADKAANSHVLRVPGSYATIQAAVDAAHSGDLVLIAPGVYHESVTVGEGHADIVIRGLDRNHVVLDGQDRLATGISVNADGVAVENLTVRHYLVNGIEWSPSGEYGGGRPLQGWRGSYITSRRGAGGARRPRPRGGRVPLRPDGQHHALDPPRQRAAAADPHDAGDRRNHRQSPDARAGQDRPPAGRPSLTGMIW